MDDLEYVYIDDLTVYKEAPRYARKFAVALLEFDQEEIIIELGNNKLHGARGLTSNIQFSRANNQFLQESLSYTFLLPNNHQLEISLQFYLNENDHHRLFTFTRCNGQVGQVFSVNLSTNRIKDGLYALKNRIKFSDRIDSDPEIAKKTRKRKQEVLCDVLEGYGYEVIDNEIYLGEFESLQGQFISTDVNQFVYDMLIITLLKGHYMGNKGYHLGFLPSLND